MKYSKTIKLKNGQMLLLRTGNPEEIEEIIKVFAIIRTESDFMRTYPDETKFDTKEEVEFLNCSNNSNNQIEIYAFVDGELAGSGGISPVGEVFKTKHRATFGVGIIKKYYGLGIGTAITEACIECAKKANYKQLELDVVADNKNAIKLYKKFGFVEYGRNPKGFCTKDGKYQELVYMAKEL